MDKSLKKIMFPAEVVNNQDPQMLGRIRAYPLDQNTRAVLEGYSFNPATDTWGPKDPFVQLPLLPMFLSQVPEVGERVNLIYQNSFYPFQDQYYVQGAFSTPMSLPFENIQAANKYTSLGDRVLSTLSVKNKDGSYKNEKSYGVFPEPGDNALLGRGAADVIVRRNSVILRAGKTKRFDTNKLPIGNTNRAFVQVSNFDSTIVSKKTQTLIKLGTANQQIKKMVEWEVQNLENQQNAFTGSIRLFSLKPVNKTLSDNIDYDTDLEDVKSLEYYQNFIGYSFERTVKLINDFIIGVNNGQIPNGPIVENQFPFIYRPNVTARKILKSISTTADPVVFTNTSKIANAITLNPGLGNQATKYAIVRSKGEVGKPIKVNLEDVVPKEVVENYGTFLASGADTVYLLSHKSNKPIDLEGTLYGITQQDIVDKIQPFTSSMVRGEELIDLLNLIVRFLVAHVHPVPGTPPVPVATDGTQSSQILFELQNAVNKILNPNIRIN